jgi:hypothetical protein
MRPFADGCVVVIFWRWRMTWITATAGILCFCALVIFFMGEGEE